MCTMTTDRALPIANSRVGRREVPNSAKVGTSCGHQKHKGTLGKCDLGVRAVKMPCARKQSEPRIAQGLLATCRFVVVALMLSWTGRGQDVRGPREGGRRF